MRFHGFSFSPTSANLKAVFDFLQRHLLRLFPSCFRIGYLAKGSIKRLMFVFKRLNTKLFEFRTTSKYLEKNTVNTS